MNAVKDGLTVGIVDNDYCASMMIASVIQRRIPQSTILWQCDHSQTILEHVRFDSTLPDVVIVDLMLNGISGIDICRLIRNHTSDIGILCVTAYPLSSFVEPLVAAGSQSLLQKKDIVSEEFVRAIEHVSQGKSYPEHSPFLSATQSHVQMKQNNKVLQHNKIDIPSPRELEILRCYDNGMSTEEIASSMRITSDTVFSHIHHILLKVHARNRKEALSICHNLHLL